MSFNYEDALKKIKAVFAAVEAPAQPAPVATAPVTLEALEYKLVDGTAVMIDKIEAGGTITVAGQPAPDGEHTLEDGTVLVTAGGVITEVKPPAQIPAPEAEETPDFGAKFEAMEQRLSKAEALAQSHEAALAATAQTITGLISIVEQLTKAPTAEPAAPAPGKFGAQKAPVDSKRDWLEQLNEGIKKIKS